MHLTSAIFGTTPLKQNMNSNGVAWWQPLWDFTIHVLVGTGIFLVITIVAVGLSEFVHWLERHRVDKFIVIPVQGMEYLLFGSDVILFTLFIIYNLIKVVKGYGNK